MPVDSGDDGFEVRVTLTQDPPYGDSSKESVYLRQVGNNVRKGMPAAAVLLAASALFSAWAPLEFLDGAVMRKVAQLRSAYDGALKKDALVIQQLEMAAPARVAELEMKESASAEVERVGGVAPVDRGQMAKVLSSLAKRLKAEGTTRPMPLVAIDVDLAPLGSNATLEAHVIAMHDALRELRATAHVVSIVLSRESVEARRLRNKFMVDSECTRYRRDAPESRNNRGQLYFASPRLFHPVHGYPIAFPYELNDQDEARSPAFPSVGTLIHLHRRNSPSASDRGWYEKAAKALQALADALAESWTGRDAPTQRVKTLTFLCEQAYADANPDSDALLLEDRLAAPQTEKMPTPYEQWVAPYKMRQFNWRLLDTPQLRYTVVESIAAMKPESTELLAADNFDSKVLVLSLDGGARHDKFDVAGVSPEPVGGAALHSLQALSLDDPFEESAWRGLLLDIFVGVSFSLALALLGPLLMRLHASMPMIGSWLTAATPLAVGWLWMWGSMHLAAWAMDADVWINPAYLIAGIALDSYLDGWRRALPADSTIPDGKGWWFGVDTALAALREGYGVRRQRLNVVVNTEDTRLAVSAPVERGLPGALVADEVLCALLRITVLVAGLFFIVKKLLQGVPLP